MTTNVAVPSVGESVTEAILIKWLKHPGDRVEIDEPLCELETDKANVDVPAPAAGFFRPLKAEGETVGVGETIAVLEETRAGLPAPGGNGAEPPAASGPAAAAAAPAAGPPDQRPAVRRLLEEHGLEARSIRGTGPGGALTKEDVEEYLRNRQARTPAPAASRDLAVRTPAPAPAVAPPPAPAPARIERPARAPVTDAAARERREPMSKLRRRIAQRLVAAQHETAMLTTFNEVDLTEVKALRARYKEAFEKAHGVGLGFMSFFSKAVTLALQDYPEVNAFLDGDDLVYHDYVNLGIAVSTDRGLVVPVIQDVDQLSLGEIESEIKRVALAARDGKLGLEEMSGGTFTITNGGVFGSLMSTPILNRPQSGILGMHTIQDRPVVRDGQVVARPMMYVALSYDHRVIDGRQSVGFLIRVKQLLEDPARMLLEI